MRPPICGVCTTVVNIDTPIQYACLLSLSLSLSISLSIYLRACVRQPCVCAGVLLLPTYHPLLTRSVELRIGVQHRRWRRRNRARADPHSPRMRRSTIKPHSHVRRRAVHEARAVCVLDVPLQQARLRRAKVSLARCAVERGARRRAWGEEGGGRW